MTCGDGAQLQLGRGAFAPQLAALIASSTERRLTFFPRPEIAAADHRSPGRNPAETFQEVTDMALDIKIVEDGKKLLHHPSV
ncbi:hypothetical protein [Streptomyces alkaliterrae]|uniref:Uncharacterized protein n=1 Tax=Streptomyces alkaliterrae TaxID=2213162 RepID=A0A5P0YTR8_9ACTN|nr:hypothetical protein [Streptomyces alkaliterrae]MBB1255731.1 hypothetical protein [Streptomyces alkaliterrae]MBB1261629.1 hypothetical protein [Streptomyces alkaliterrae]MQS03695.1 hypothetical protein [Streptomyces alkaliterrae]